MGEFKFFRGSKKSDFHGLFGGFIRRVYGGLVANDLVQVQPMDGPEGRIFYFDFRYGDNNKNCFKFFRGLNYDVL